MNDVIDNLNDILYSSAINSKVSVTRPISNETIQNMDGRVLKIIKSKSSQDLWKSIDWQGCFSFDRCNKTQDKPSDAEFTKHFKTLLNNNALSHSVPNIDLCPNIPILDQEISPIETDAQIKLWKSLNKSGGPRGIPPAAIKYLPSNWIVYITFIFNAIFFGSFPLQWHYAKMIPIFKKGSPKLTENYRGISISDTLVKHYDGILNQRFMKWFKPDPEQAGGQPGRSCQEQIINLRLLIDIAKKKRRKLFIVFIDFSAAYDRVDRNLLFYKLRNAGIGKNFLRAIITMYALTYLIIGSETFSTNVGLKQGHPTSVLLFLFYINSMFRLLKEAGDDDWLRNIHVLALMDDTVVVASSRAMILKKLRIIKDFCDSHNMLFNESKTKLMVINGSSSDRDSIHLDTIIIKHADWYLYLGSPITEDGLISSVITKHIELKKHQLDKFNIFIHKHKYSPFVIKRKVLESIIRSSIFYGCETFLTNNYGKLLTLYSSCVKTCLGVRPNTCNDLCYLELGISSPQAFIKDKQFNFFKKLFSDRDNHETFLNIYDQAKSVNCNISNSIETILQSNGCFVTNDIRERVSKIQNSQTTRRLFYKSINPDLIMHEVYSINPKIIYPESHRLTWTQLRLGSTRLPCELGRWNRDVIRTCKCGFIPQTETHIVIECMLSKFNASFNLRTLQQLSSNNKQMMKYIHDTVKLHTE